MRYALKVAYDGTNYCGWQIQKNGNTVQAELERAISECFSETANVTASGRTDSGVHAKGQVCHVDLKIDMPGNRLADALNAKLPPDICVVESCSAPENFDANRSAKRKTYRYKFYISPRRDPLKDRYSCWVKGNDDIEEIANKMREIAPVFVGEHDFKAYCASGSQVLTTVREVYSIEICSAENEISVDVCGGGFLYNMVRTMVGTLLFYALGRLKKEQVITSIEKCDRSQVGKTMPANGLTLLSVEYGVKLF